MRIEFCLSRSIGEHARREGEGRQAGINGCDINNDPCGHVGSAEKYMFKVSTYVACQNIRWHRLALTISPNFHYRDCNFRRFQKCIWVCLHGHGLCKQWTILSYRRPTFCPRRDNQINHFFIHTSELKRTRTTSRAQAGRFAKRYYFSSI